jgi:hypothetical protein
MNHHDPLSRRIEEPTLFGLRVGTATTPPGPAIHSNPMPTELAAAVAVAPKLPELRGKALLAVIRAGERGITAKEGGAMLAAERGLPASDGSCRYTFAPRLTELRDAGLIEANGQKRDGAAVFVATDAGRKVAQS